MRYANSVIDLVGDTPLVKLNRVTEGVRATVLVKVEYLNPGGSSKDRIATRILDAAEELLTGVEVVLETSWPPGLATLRPERVRRLIRRHGAERVVFGSDWPMTDPAAELKAIDALGLTDNETKAVLGGTMARVLNID